MIPGRRKFIIFMASLPVIASSDIQQLFSTSTNLKKHFHKHFHGILQEVASARVIGRAYMATHDIERNIDQLVTALFSNESERDSFFIAASEEQRHLLGNMIQTDFKYGRLVTVNGWLLSRTEARVYAIASMLS